MNAPTPAQRHLVTVWNPSYAVNAMEQHLAVLLEMARRYEADEIGADQLYVWWGKVRSPNRQAPQANIKELQSLARSVEAAEHDETQLYLTDYQSLYVGDVDRIVEGELPAAEASHVPAYYARAELKCDFWFRLRDIRRLVSNDMTEVIAELRKLRNIHYNDRPVSLFGGMVDLPLFVIRPDRRRFFDEQERDAQTDGDLWVEFDASMGSGVGATERALRDNVLGELAWGSLTSAARSFTANAEKLFREHRNDPAFDFASVITSFSKALEVQVNATLREGCTKLGQQARMANLNGATVDVASHGHLSLGELVRAIGSERALNEGLRRVLENGGWFTGSLPPILDEFRAVRNDGTHSSRVDRATATHWRNRLLGVGCKGVLVDLAETRLKAGS
jgi:hypothetical protein